MIEIQAKRLAVSGFSFILHRDVASDIEITGIVGNDKHEVGLAASVSEEGKAQDNSQYTKE